MTPIPLLTEMSDATIGIGIGAAEMLGHEYKVRKNARAILLDDHGQIAIQHLVNHHFHKLPGGGVDDGETVEMAVLREIKEEVGCAATIIRPLGLIIEYRDKYKLLHLSYGFVCQVAGPIAETTFEASELAAGQTNIWITPTAALEHFKTDNPTTYEGKFILPREATFLEEYLRTK